MKAFTVDVNPKVLVWARNEAGVSDLNEVANYLKRDVGILESWEQDGKEVRYTDLRKLATYYKRQLPVFFLPEVPKKVKNPKDYRNLNLRSEGLHRDTRLAIRRANRYLDFYKKNTSEGLIEAQYKWLRVVQSTQGDTATQLRKLLKVSISKQREIRTDNFKFWREKVEEILGIFVFQFPIKNDEFDGFSYVANGKPYAITLNSQIADNRKVFTIFHEVAHIIEGQTGICLTGDGARVPYGLEAKCNQFAAEFLMPEKEVIPPISYRELRANADGLGVSAEAYLIRCKNLGLLDEKGSLYRELEAEIQRKKKEYKKTTSKGGPPPLVLSKSQRGEKFFDFVVSVYDAQKISSSVVRDILDVKVVGLSRQDKYSHSKTKRHLNEHPMSAIIVL
jgi:Zn-dependent peptidase ImmA (M78 family)